MANTGGICSQQSGRSEVPTLIKLRTAVATEQIYLQSGCTHMEKLWKEKTLVSKRVWCHRQADVWLRVTYIFLIQNSVLGDISCPVPTVTVGGWCWFIWSRNKILDAARKDHFGDPLGYSVFYTFLYHLLPPSVKVRTPITRDPWLDSVWPLRFCFLLIPSCLKVPQSSCVQRSLPCMTLLCWSAAWKKGCGR